MNIQPDILQLTDLPPELISKLYMHTPQQFRLACRYIFTATSSKSCRSKYLMSKYGRNQVLTATCHENTRLLHPDVTDELMCFIATRLLVKVSFETFQLALESNKPQFVSLILHESSNPNPIIVWNEDDAEYFDFYSLISISLHKSTRCNSGHAQKCCFDTNLLHSSLWHCNGCRSEGQVVQPIEY